MHWIAVSLPIIAVHLSLVYADLFFSSDGTFKIAQFADLHFGEAENTLWGPQQDVNSTRVMDRVLSWEKPSFVVYTGDQVTGENINSNATGYWARLVSPCVTSKTPWATVFGNHDDLSSSHGTRKELLAFDTSYNLSLSRFGPSSIHGLTNYFLIIYDNEESMKPLWVLYFLDSGGGSYPELVYDDQIEWFKNTSTQIKLQYGPLPALTFFHIPSTAYQTVYHKTSCFGMFDDQVTPQIKQNELLKVIASFGNTKAVFVGHDHGNDWCCPFSEMLVCYGRHTGYGGYGRWPRGSRIILLTEGSTHVKTYVRMEDGTIIDGN